MHIPNISKIFLPPAFGAYRPLPRPDQVENLRHDWTGEWRWALGEASYELVEELFGGDLEVEGVPTLLDERVEQGECKEGDMRVAVVDDPGDCHCCFSWAGAYDIGIYKSDGQEGSDSESAAQR